MRSDGLRYDEIDFDKIRCTLTIEDKDKIRLRKAR